MTQKKLIITLIKDDLINTKLINGLNEIGIEANHFHLYLSEIIFSLMGIVDEEIYESKFELYVDLTKKVKDIDIKSSNIHIEELANEIFEKLTSISS